jgi:hypothetical protein
MKRPRRRPISEAEFRDFKERMAAAKARDKAERQDTRVYVTGAVDFLVQDVSEDQPALMRIFGHDVRESAPPLAGGPVRQAGCRQKNGIGLVDS